MKELAFYSDYVLSIMTVISVVLNLVFTRFIFGKEFSALVYMELILTSLRISMGSWNIISIFNWTTSILIYGFLIAYDQYIYITVTAAVVVIFCVFYLLLDIVRPVEI